MRIEIDAGGLGRLERTLRRALRLWSDTTPMMDEIGDSLLADVHRRFEDQVAPDGTAWAPLAPRTVAARDGEAAPILRRSGELYRSITTRAGNGRVAIGSNKPYAGVHQYGRAERNIPARPYLPTNPATDRDFLAGAAAVIRAAFRRGFA